MKNFTAIEDHSFEAIKDIITLAEFLKKEENKYTNLLNNKTLVSMFFNPSTRTKTSFELAMKQLGGHCITLEPGKSSWGIEIKEGAVMNGEAEEHLKDGTKVLCRYGDALAVRCFPKFINWEEEKKDEIIKNMIKWSDKPIINMETISHPCQAMAMLMTMKEKFGNFNNLKGKKFVLTWAYHPKGLNTAVANSAAMIASMTGMNLTIVNPEGYNLDKDYIDQFKENCSKNNAKFEIVHDMEEGVKEADFLYIKSWGPISEYGKFQTEDFLKKHSQKKNWIVDEKIMQKTNNAFVSHCLPVKRNVLVSDNVLDSKKSIIYDEAENRLHAQKAILAKLLCDEKQIEKLTIGNKNE